MSAITFNEKEHKYIRSGTQYVSVTTLIHKYIPPFDSEYWSRYKAIKAVFESYGIWSDYKWQAGGWENVVSYYNVYGHRLSEEVMVKQREILADWANKGRVAREKGSEVHEDLEKRILGASHVRSEEGDILVSPEQIEAFDPIDKGNNIILPEVIVYNDQYQIAGMIDRVEKKGRNVSLRDYKTSKVITKDSFRDQMMFDPVAHLPNANFYEYSLQLSLYAWMIECFGYNIKKLTVEHRSRDNGELIDTYPVKYLRKEIISILEDYDKKRQLQA